MIVKSILLSTVRISKEYLYMSRLISTYIENDDHTNAKFMFIRGEADKGNSLAKQYLEKLRNEEVSIDWTHRVIISSIRQKRMLKMMAIADDRHFSYDNELEIIQFIASEMQKEGLDEENLDSYLNTKFM
jgi:hypothetical protein